MTIKQLREEFARIHTEAGSVIASAETANRDLTADEKGANEKRFARLATIQSLIAEKGKYAKLGLDNVLATRASGDKIDRAEFGKSLFNWFRTGATRQFATITTATASSLLLPVSVMAPIVTGASNSFRDGFAAWGQSPMSSPGDASQFNIPIIDPTAGGLVAQNATSETENAPSFSESMVSTVNTYQSGTVRYSNLQLAAARFDLLSATVPGLYNNKELGVEAAIAAALVADAGITQVVTTPTTAGFTFATSVSLANKLPKRYQKFKVRFLSQEAYAAAEGLVDTYGRPVMVNDAQNQTLVKMHGVPVIRCDYLENFGASKVIGIELSLTGFHLRDAGEGLARYENDKSFPDQTGVNLFGYHAYDWAVSAVAKLKTPAS